MTAKKQHESAYELSPTGMMFCDRGSDWKPLVAARTLDAILEATGADDVAYDPAVFTDALVRVEEMWVYVLPQIEGERRIDVHATRAAADASMATKW